MRILYGILITLFMVNILAAQSLSGYKICIDPGHGGHDAANDRHIVAVDFWESEGNIGKGLHLREILDSLGAEVILTRTENDDSDDLGLSVRAGIANANNVDYFHSIHSNATGTSNRVNFPLILFRGYTNGPVFPESKVFASEVWKTIYDAKYGVWSRHTEYIAGDWTFYPSWGTSGLGVLRPLNMPGTLSEGSFHDYLPEATRLKNDAYLRHEAWAIARAFVNHYGVDPIETGIVAGIVRDPEKYVPSSYQAISGTMDNREPVNFVKAVLNPGNRVYIGDEGDNGYYFFDNVQPGQYSLIVEADNHTADTTDITVSAGESSFFDVLLTEVPNYNVPQVTETFPLDQSTDQSTRDTIEISFNIRMDETSTEAAFNISPDVQGEFIWADARKTLQFFPLVPFEQQTEYTVTVGTSAKTFYNVNLGSELSFNFTTGVASDAGVVSTYPLNGAENISNASEIIIGFDTRMNDITTEEAFSIVPDAEGTFSWNEDFTEMHFVPSDAYSKGELHTVTVSTSARTYFGGYLGEEFSFSFTTRSKLNIVSMYPADGDTGISKSVMIRMAFEMPIKAASLPGNVLFNDENGNFISPVVNTAAYAKGWIEFEPTSPLQPGKEYTVILKDGISDIENVTFNEEIVVKFTTDKLTYHNGEIISDFESSGDWQQPGESDNSIGIDKNETSFEIQSERVYDAENAGKLNYVFNSTNGVCELAAYNSFDIGTKGSIRFGIWIYGDLSGNSLDYSVADGSGNSERVFVSDLNWTGWKLMSLPEENLTLQGDIALTGIVVRQVEGADTSGVIYIDAAQTDYTTPVEEVTQQPVDYSLEQNYPNPFNPTTNINFSLAEEGAVSLVVYNLLGEVVARIIDNVDYSSGQYSVEWNARNVNGHQLPSGIYFYELKTDKYNSVRKMILLR